MLDGSYIFVIVTPWGRHLNFETCSNFYMYYLCYITKRFVGKYIDCRKCKVLQKLKTNSTIELHTIWGQTKGISTNFVKQNCVRRFYVLVSVRKRISNAYAIQRVRQIHLYSNHTTFLYIPRQHWGIFLIVRRACLYSVEFVSCVISHLVTTVPTPRSCLKFCIFRSMHFR